MTTPPPPEPPDFPDAASEEERSRLKWAWRDGLSAGVAWLKGDVEKSLAEIKQQIAEITPRRPLPWQERDEGSDP